MAEETALSAERINAIWQSTAEEFAKNGADAANNQSTVLRMYWRK
jgi:hypothetical protein